MKKITLISLLFMLVFSSCTVEKMRYSRGYHIEWIGKKNHVVSSKNIKEKKLKCLEEIPQTKSEIIDEKLPEFETSSEIVRPEIAEISKEKNNKTHQNIPILKPLKKADIKTEIRKRNPENFTQKNTIYKTEKTQLVGIALFIVAFVFALLGYIFFLILGVFFGPIFLVIFLIAAVIYFIAGILSLIF